MPYTGTCPAIVVVRDHPVAATLVIGALSLLCIVLFIKYDNQKSGFTTGTACGSQRCHGKVCKSTWDPAASAEAQGLATVGAANFQHSDQANAKLMAVINGAVS